MRELYDSTGIILPDDDLSGDDATQAYFMVEAYSDNIEHGFVMGKGHHQLGSFAKLSAIPFDGCVFDGWYINDEKVSSDIEYRFLVTGDITLTAKFTKLTISVSDLIYNGTFTYDTINLSMEGEIPSSVYVVINKYNAVNSLTSTISTTVSIDNSGIGVWSPVSSSVQINTLGEHIEIIVYEDNTCERQYGKLTVNPTLFEFD